MKKFSALLLSVFVLFMFVSFCQAEIKVDLGMQMRSAEQESINVKSSVVGSWRTDETGFKLKHAYYREKLDNELVTSRNVTVVQAAYYFTEVGANEYMAFVSGGSFADTEFDMDELRLGIGMGMSTTIEKFELETKLGAYILDQEIEQMSAVQMDGCGTYQITDVLSLKPSLEVMYNLDEYNYITVAGLEVELKASDRISVAVGTELFYDEMYARKHYTVLRLSL